MINEYIDHMLIDKDSFYILGYFDFNCFKAFNDKYGFRQGDRAILMFADVLKEISRTDRFFVGHVGGDDFFAGFGGETVDVEGVTETVRGVVARFKDHASSLYDPEYRQRGYIVTPDRDGNVKAFPLLTVSAVVLAVPPGERSISLDEFGRLLARLKKEAKRSPDGLVFSAMDAWRKGTGAGGIAA